MTVLSHKTGYSYILEPILYKVLKQKVINSNAFKKLIHQTVPGAQLFILFFANEPWKDGWMDELVYE